MVDVIPADCDDIPSKILGETWNLPFQEEYSGLELDSEPSVIVLAEPGCLDNVFSEKLHGFDTDSCGKHERHQYHCLKFYQQLRVEANERMLSDSDMSSSDSTEMDSESDEGCYMILRQARKLRRRLMHRRKRRGGCYNNYETLPEHYEGQHNLKKRHSGHLQK